MTVNLFIGLLVSSFFIEIAGVYPGGIIVPAYLAMYMDQPFRVAGTLIVSLVCYGSYKILSGYTILFGRRRFVILIFLGSLWLLIWNKLLVNDLFQGLHGFYAIGLVIPGLIANTYERQGIALTLVALLIAVTMTGFLVKLISLFI
jgi:poly-gamma-glutamate biosynthesis protein PgsC/CapC